MFKIDLHTHSTASKDGGISPDQYEKALSSGVLDFVAITDHDTIEMALQMNKKHGSKVIVGEEIMTCEGEIIGLFLDTVIEPGQSAIDTVKAIKAQNGLVYIPHPLETLRKGLSAETLEQIKNYIDIVEVFNARAVVQNRGSKAAAWAKMNSKAVAAASDAHGVKALGRTYTQINEAPTKENLVNLLIRSQMITKRPPFKTLFYPKANRAKKLFKLLA